MNAQKRIRPLLSTAEAFRMPQVILLPAALVSCALVPMAAYIEPFSFVRLAAIALAALAFAVIFIIVVVIPAIHAQTLKQDGVDGTAVILSKGTRTRILHTAQYRAPVEDDFVIFEFTPKGASAPLRLDAEVGKLHSRLAEGQSAKIRYAASNPRIVRFKGE
jgi:hypothetical protein